MSKVLENKKLIIGLYGIQGTYNFGCEAIVRGAYKFAKDIYPNSKVVYFSFSPDYDRKSLADLGIEIIPVIRKVTLVKRLINKGYKLLHIQKQIAMFNTKRIIETVDLIISIGGDIYTIPQVLREKNRYSYYNPLVDFCSEAIRKGKKVIVYGASVGPWGNYKRAINYNVKALSKYQLILCREEKSISYLQSLGLKNVVFFPDPAFQIRGHSEIASQKKYIGINLSPLSLKELYGSCNKKYISSLAVLLDRLYDETKLELLFIPHVLSSNEMDNDLWFMKKIKGEMRCSQHVTIADTDNGFIGIKEYLAQCYVVAAARMHCAINAIDENIPAIFLAYSQKSIGMCEFIYGDSRFLIDMNNIESDLIERVKIALSQSAMLSEYIKKRNGEIRRYYEDNIAQVQGMLNNEESGV